MVNDLYTIPAETNTKTTVLAFISALNRGDFKAARGYVQEDMSFVGVMGSRNGAEAYFNDMEKMKLKYEIKKTFAEDDDVCLLYDINMSGVTVFCCGWYHLKGDKIDSIRVIFDPRPVLEKK